MNSISTAIQAYDYSLPSRRTSSVVAVGNTPQRDRNAESNLPAKTHSSEHVIQGEIVNNATRSDLLQLRGVTLVGHPSRASDAVTAYRQHQTISPATVQTPGSLLHISA